MLNDNSCEHIILFFTLLAIRNIVINIKLRSEFYLILNLNNEFI